MFLCHDFTLNYFILTQVGRFFYFPLESRPWNSALCSRLVHFYYSWDARAVITYEPSPQQAAGKGPFLSNPYRERNARSAPFADNDINIFFILQLSSSFPLCYNRSPRG